MDQIGINFVSGIDASYCSRYIVRLSRRRTSWRRLPPWRSPRPFPEPRGYLLRRAGLGPLVGLSILLSVFLPVLLSLLPALLLSVRLSARCRSAVGSKDLYRAVSAGNPAVGHVVLLPWIEGILPVRKGMSGRLAGSAVNAPGLRAGRHAV